MREWTDNAGGIRNFSWPVLACGAAVAAVLLDGTSMAADLYLARCQDPAALGWGWLDWQHAASFPFTSGLMLVMCLPLPLPLAVRTRTWLASLLLRTSAMALAMPPACALALLLAAASPGTAAPFVYAAAMLGAGTLAHGLTQHLYAWVAKTRFQPLQEESS